MGKSSGPVSDEKPDENPPKVEDTICTECGTKYSGNLKGTFLGFPSGFCESCNKSFFYPLSNKRKILYAILFFLSFPMVCAGAGPIALLIFLLLGIAILSNGKISRKVQAILKAPGVKE
ncbi:MAG: hypothetical protein RDU59_12765 [Thermodesulfobacteriota bacterium]|nr:hypothetical protein [Thermodesulfobacteriota bacterium]